MFAPTVTGSPLESACRVISRYEPHGRGYYAGMLALIGRDGAGRQALDSAIAIRTADIDSTGRVRIDVGATLVRHSDPLSEAAETRGKAEALLAALGSGTGPGTTGAAPDVWEHPEIRRALQTRNERLARFWLLPQDDRFQPVPELLGRTALVIDCEDDFTAMLGHQLTALGLEVTIRRFDAGGHGREDHSDGHDLVVVGPGPGDPRATGDPKISTMRGILRRALDEGRPMLAVCLGHQVLAGMLGLDVRPLPLPNQGAQHAIQVRGRREHCGFYNTFAAHAAADRVDVPSLGGTVELDRDPVTGVVHAVRGDRFRSFQFHAESVLTCHGVDLVGEACAELLGDSASTLATARRKEYW